MQDIVEYTANNGQKYIIVDKKDQKIKNRVWEMFLIQFLDTGSTRWVYSYNHYKGKVKDLYAKTIYNVGWIGDVTPEDKKIPYYSRAKQLHRNMMKRCYCENDPKGYFKWGTQVCPRWQCFKTFLEDLPSILNFDLWLLGQNTGENKYNLDKDLRFAGSNVYSPDTCMFVDEHTNKSEGAKTTVDKYYRSIVAQH